MNASLMLRGVVTGDGKDYAIEFEAHKLQQKQQKYADKGAILLIQGMTALAPNPDPVKVVRNAMKDEQHKHGNLSKRSPDEKRGGRRPVALKAVVCLTTGEFFICITDAAMAHSLTPYSISSHINHPDKHKQVKGFRFRFATKAEQAARKMLPEEVPDEQAALLA